MSENWVSKHRPESFDEIQGNTKAIDKIEKWAKNWSEGDKPQLLVGEPGTGKTSTAMVASDELGYPLNEINTSSDRKSEDIKQFARTMQSSPIDAEYQLVLLDEVDGWHHASSKKPLYDVLRDAPNPIILTANDKYDVPNPIKNASKTHEFKLGKRSRKAKIKEIADREGVELDQSELKELAKRPDLRSAINDLQVFANSDGFPGRDNRTWSEGEFSAIQHFLGGDKKNWKESMSVHASAFNDPGSALLWLDENCSDQYRGLEQGVAYDAMSRADRHLGRAQSNSAYRYWKYASAILEELPETRLSDPYDGYIKPSFPNWFRSKESKATDSSDEAKLFQELKGEMEYRMAGSYFEFRHEVLPMLQTLPVEERYELALNHRLDPEIVSALDIDPDEYQDWRDVETVEEGDGWSPDSGSAAEVNW